jgi:hypothetical protein
MEKETLIRKLKSKEQSRKFHLFSFYTELICSFEKARVMVEEIHADLGEINLVNTADIYYCRRHYMKKKNQTLQKRKIDKAPEFSKSDENNFENLTWTNPADLERVTLKSKFAK